MSGDLVLDVSGLTPEQVERVRVVMRAMLAGLLDDAADHDPAVLPDVARERLGA